MFAVLVGLLASTIVLSTAAEATETRVPLDKRPFTVVAVVDTGINPYHVDFRAPELTTHPSSYITGFPRDAKALPLNLSAATYEEAVATDKGKWEAVEPDQLYWIPGTNIVGAIGPLVDDGNVLEGDFHGTLVSSLAGGRVHGPKTNDVLIVAVAHNGTPDAHGKGLEWAARQPWIDVITNSWTLRYHPTREEENQRIAQASRTAVEAGKLVCFGSGNSARPMWEFPSQGPSWSLIVGAASQTTRGEHIYTGWPNDVLGFGGMKGAHDESIRDESDYAFGTSLAAPNVCGQAARVISEVRGALGDYREGAGNGLANGAKTKGEYLEDGCLDRAELEDALQATAVPAETSPPDPNDPVAVPALPVAGFVRGGYGIVDHDSADAAIEVLLGRAKRPERSLEDDWIARTDSMRNEMWGPPPDPVGCR